MEKSKKNNSFIIDIDTVIENQRSVGVKDKIIIQNLYTVIGLLKDNKWDEFYINK